MAKITREQLNRWNAQAKNGFRLDLEYFLNWGEKTLIKDIKQEDAGYIRFKLYYMPEYETKTNEYGCKWNVKTGKQIPTLRIERLKPCKTEGMYQVLTVKDDVQMGEPEKTMKYSTLCKISGKIDTDKELT